MKDIHLALPMPVKQTSPLSARLPVHNHIPPPDGMGVGVLFNVQRWCVNPATTNDPNDQRRSLNATLASVCVSRSPSQTQSPFQAALYTPSYITQLFTTSLLSHESPQHPTPTPSTPPSALLEHPENAAATTPCRRSSRACEPGKALALANKNATVVLLLFPPLETDSSFETCHL